MTFEEYQAFTDTTAYYPETQEFAYLGLGLTGEAGEVADQIKKMIRDDNSFLWPERERKILLEMGDVIFYFTRLCKRLNVSISDIMELNVEKLTARHKLGNSIG